jgi:hypothetical protein
MRSALVLANNYDATPADASKQAFNQMITQSKITVELFVDSREYEAKSH